MYPKVSQKFPPFTILSFNNPSSPSSKTKGRNAYWTSAFVSIILLASCGLALALPHKAGAFWPFSVARADLPPAPILHDASLNLLTAPLNADPITESDVPVTTSDGAALIPGTGFTASNAPIAAGDKISTPSSGSISTYTVKSGDSLSEIAQQFGVSVNTILWANDIKNVSTIKEGTRLVILPTSGIEHTVKSGETLSSIAQRFGGDAGDIAKFNGLSDKGALQTGSTIIIPGGELSSGSTSKPSSSATTAKTKSSSTSSQTTPPKNSSLKVTSSVSTLKTNYSNETGNPYKGGGGSAHTGFFTNPVPGALLTQGIHGWNGVDLGAHVGTPIHAAASGAIILSRTSGWNGGYGDYLIIDNGSGIETLYAHMSRTAAEAGQTVSAGDVIGYVGTTGEATGPHLHFEVRGARNPFAGCTEMTVCSPQ
ncbi:peptidoglycan DD-metalloendopeptidase family protein [Patescibacteria group bacterium]|nr:peptidoglycan DD-metalloendopeptidase family protein [Patescibacteria group bacterium]